jgi:hypothetical protein
MLALNFIAFSKGASAYACRTPRALKTSSVNLTPLTGLP